MSGHLNSAHNMSADDYKGQYGELMSTKNLLSCQICDTELTHTYPALKYHFSGFHGLSVMQYYYQFHANKNDVKAGFIFGCFYYVGGF